MSDTIIININEANQAKKYGDNSLFQVESFKKLEDILNEHNVGKNNDNIVNCRFHDTIFIDGARGVGKTAFMLNIKSFYTQDKKHNKENKKYLFLDPVDPTLLENTEKFLSVVLARVVEETNCDINNDFSEKYFESLSNLSKSLSAIKTLSDDIGIEEIASNKSSLKLEQYAHIFFKVVSEMYNVEGIVILIDDIDMAFDKGFDVLEVIRKYLASPYIIPIVAGDMKLYREIVETQFMKKIRFHEDIGYLKSIYGEEKLQNSVEYKEKSQLIGNLVEQYLYKLFPIEYTIELKDIFSILKDNKVEIILGTEKKISYSDLRDFEIRHINFGINQEEFIFDVFENNAREFMQYIYTKKTIYKEFFIENSDSFEYVSFNIPHIIDKMDTKIKTFMLNTKLYQNSLSLTSLKYKNKQGKKNELYRLSNNDKNSFMDGKYNIYKAFTNDFFKSSKLVNEDAFKEFSIEATNFNSFTKKKSLGMEKYITSLFVFNDYYTQHQTKNYLYSGKFIEMLIYSLSIHEKIDLKNTDKLLVDDDPFKEGIKSFKDRYDPIYQELYNDENSEFISTKKPNNQEANEELLNIARKIPFNSTLTNNKRFLDDNEIDSDNEEEAFLEDDGENIYEKIVIWRNIFYPDMRISSPALYEILHKFFNNYGLAKNLKLNDTPLEFMQRTVLIFINAIAYFESSDKGVANTNMAVNIQFDLDNIFEKTNAYTLNIKPMFKVKGSLTNALFFHPLIYKVLFPEKDTGLSSLQFRKTNKNKNKTKTKTNNKLYNLLNINYQKCFINNSYKKGMDSGCHTLYINSQIDLLKKSSVKDKNIMIEILQKNKYYLVYQLMKNNWKESDDINILKDYENLVFGED